MLCTPRDWQQIAQGEALTLVGMQEGRAKLVEATRYGACADEIERLQREFAAEKERADYAWRNTNTIEKARQEEMAKRDELAKSMRDVYPVAHRLALELEALLLSCNDNAAVSKWWDSAHEALEQWRKFCSEEQPHG